MPGGKRIALHKPGQRPDHISLSELSRDELLHQQAVRQGLLELSRTEVWTRGAVPSWRGNGPIGSAVLSAALRAG